MSKTVYTLAEMLLKELPASFTARPVKSPYESLLAISRLQEDYTKYTPQQLYALEKLLTVYESSSYLSALTYDPKNAVLFTNEKSVASKQMLLERIQLMPDIITREEFIMLALTLGSTTIAPTPTPRYARKSFVLTGNFPNGIVIDKAIIDNLTIQNSALYNINISNSFVRDIQTHHNICQNISVAHSFVNNISVTNDLDFSNYRRMYKDSKKKLDSLIKTPKTDNGFDTTTVDSIYESILNAVEYNIPPKRTLELMRLNLDRLYVGNNEVHTLRIIENKVTDNLLFTDNTSPRSTLRSNTIVKPTKGSRMSYKIVDDTILLDGVQYPFTNVDGYDCVVLNETTLEGVSFKKCLYLGRNEYIYIATHGDFSAHGETLEDAKYSLIYKINHSQNSNYKLEDYIKESQQCTIVTEAIYRKITGACLHGINLFKKENNLENTTSISTEELLKILTPNNYGYNKFITYHKRALDLMNSKTKPLDIVKVLNESNDIML